MRKRLIVVLVMALTISALVVGPAAAGPDNRNSFGPIAVDCGPAGTISVIGHGNGRFAAAQVIGSTDVLVPLAFKDASFTYTAPDGTVFPPEFEPDVAKGSGKQQGIWCQYSFDLASGNGSERFSGHGDVYARIVPGT